MSGEKNRYIKKILRFCTRCEKNIFRSRSDIQSFNTPLLFYLFWMFFFLVPMSCVEETERLTRAERKVVDSLVVKQTKILRKMSDSLCAVDFEESVTEVVDSIRIKRLGDIKKIIDQ